MKTKKILKQYNGIFEKLRQHKIYYSDGYLRQQYRDKGLKFTTYIKFNKPKKELELKFINVTKKEFEKSHEEIISLIKGVHTKYPLLDLKEINNVVCKHLNPNILLRNFYKKVEVEIELLCIEKEKTMFEDISDYPEVFPLARARKRKIYAFLGQTNSGKTYSAMSEIANSFTSTYLAPLRLLALETYEYLNDQGIETSLITGEEKILKPNSQCTSSTVECFNYEKYYETVVIDEIQMIDDLDRGWAFIQALVGANADKVIVTGPEEYKDKLKAIADYLGEEIEIKIFKRKSEIKPLPKPVSINKVKKNTAIVAFSRKAVYEIKKQLPKHLKSSVIYGALGYQVRKLQAEKFINGETDVLITTDAVGMGLNLPIETMIFSTDKKFDGRSFGLIDHMLVKQIAGRAGRFGKYDIGYYGGMSTQISSYVNECMNTPLIVTMDEKLAVSPPSFYIDSLLDNYKLSTILTDWTLKEKFHTDSIFQNANMANKIKVSTWLEKRYPEQAKKYWNLVNCPIDYDKDMDIFSNYVKQMFTDKIICPDLGDIRMYNVQSLEQMIKELTILCWFGNQFDKYCEDNFLEKVRETLENVNNILDSKLTR